MCIRDSNKIIVFVIWEVGVPRIAPAAERRDTHPQEGTPAAEQRAATLRANAITILEWLDGAARSILRYKQTLEHQEARRRVCYSALLQSGACQGSSITKSGACHW